MPLGVDDRVFGVLALLWPTERTFSDDDRVTISALTAYTASAVQRALLLQDRVDTALILQSALVTTLPDVVGTRPGRPLPPRRRPRAGGRGLVRRAW